ncbi:MAG: DNA primase [Alphaproteobacteria bacterium]
MTFPSDFLDAIRARIGLGEAIARRVRLERRGREFVGLCPFHNEKTPSFTVVEDKGFFHCFGCGAHGDVIGFVMRADNLSFPEAVARLAEEAGLPMPASRPGDAEHARRQASLYEVVEQATRWFQAQLAGAQGHAARDYLHGRGLKAETIERFRLGHAPDSRGALKAALTSAGVPEPMLIEAGLLAQPDSGGASYDRLRGRVVFPISDPRGRVVGFGGRILGAGEPKYLNSPETPLFHKGSLLYGLAQARLPAREAGRVVVVEGYMDVIALHQAGIANAVAPLGTALGDRQLELLWRVAPEVAVCLDADTAGFNAAVRAYQRALPLLAPERELAFVLGAGGKDPDEVVRTQGPEAMRARIAGARPWYEVVWDVHLNALKGHANPEPRSFGPQERARLEADLKAVAGGIGHEGLRRHIQRYFKDRAWQFFDPRRSQRSAAPGRSPARVAEPGPPPANPLGKGPQGSPIQREREMVKAVVIHPGLLARIEDEFTRFHPSDARLDALCRKILEVAAATPDLDRQTLARHLEEHGFADVLAGMVAGGDWKARSATAFARAEAPLDEVERGWRDAHVLHQEKVLRDEVEEAFAAGRDNPTDKAWEQLKALKQVRLTHGAPHGATQDVPVGTGERR